MFVGIMNAAHMLAVKKMIYDAAQCQQTCTAVNVKENDRAFIVCEHCGHAHGQGARGAVINIEMNARMDLLLPMVSIVFIHIAKRQRCRYK